MVLFNLLSMKYIFLFERKKELFCFSDKMRKLRCPWWIFLLSWAVAVSRIACLIHSELVWIISATTINGLICTKTYTQLITGKNAGYSAYMAITWTYSRTRMAKPDSNCNIMYLILALSLNWIYLCTARWTITPKLQSLESQGNSPLARIRLLFICTIWPATSATKLAYSRLIRICVYAFCCMHLCQRRCTL